METTTDVPASYRIRRTVPPYKPAKTPYVGKQVAWTTTHGLTPVVVIREVEGSRGVKAGSYWIAPILDDGSIGPMTTCFLGAQALTREPQS